MVKQADKIATGHNADDIAETVLLNILRGDLPRLSRCAAIITGALLPGLALPGHAFPCLALPCIALYFCDE